MSTFGLQQNYQSFSLDIEAKVAHLRFNQPQKHNCMTRQFWQELPEALQTLSDNALARVVVISAEGKHFCAGLDLDIFTQLNQVGKQDTALEAGRQGEAFYNTISGLQAALSALEQIRLPVLVAIQGACVGGGLDLALACDSRYCSETAYFSVMETKLGMTADVGTLQRIQHVIPAGLARELVYTGRTMLAQEAEQSGLVNRVFADAETMLNEVMAIATEIASNSPLSVYGCKTMLNYAREHSMQDSLDYQALWQAATFHQQDMQESFTAKAEQRSPEYPDLYPVKKQL